MSTYYIGVYLYVGEIFSIEISPETTNKVELLEAKNTHFSQALIIHIEKISPT